jgi:hypothetical protein
MSFDIILSIRSKILTPVFLLTFLKIIGLKLFIFFFFNFHIRYTGQVSDFKQYLSKNDNKILRLGTKKRVGKIRENTCIFSWSYKY